MRKLVVCFVGLLALASAALANIAGTGGPPSIQCNYDLINKGADAYDVALVVSGDASSWTSFYADYFPSTPTVTRVGSSSILHWQNPPGVIGRDAKIHVGFTPVGTNGCPLLDAYWTDINGVRIRSSIVGTVYNHLLGTQESLTNLSPGTVRIDNVRVACQAAALPLAALNATNEYLSSSMVTIAGSIILAPGETRNVPFTPPCSNCHCVTSFNTSGDGLGAIFTPWVQEHID